MLGRDTKLFWECKLKWLKKIRGSSLNSGLRIADNDDDLKQNMESNWCSDNTLKANTRDIKSSFET